MALFSPLEESSKGFDYSAIVERQGLTVVDWNRKDKCRDWLRRHGYAIDSIDCLQGYQPVLAQLGLLLNWEKQFGYRIEESQGNLNALNDGFYFEVSENGGRVLELVHPDRVWREEPRWMMGLLSIAKEYSHRELARGRRFFTLLVLSENSLMAGQVVDQSQVPCPWWSPCKEVNEFERD